MLQNIQKVLAVLLCSSTTLFASVLEDENKIQKITDSPSCLSTFKNILKDTIKVSDSEVLRKAQPEINNVTDSIKLYEKSPPEFEYMAWELYPKFAKAYCQLNGLGVESDELFCQQGYQQGKIDETLNANFIKSFQNAKTIPFMSEDCDPNYWTLDLGISVEEELNSNNNYVMLEDEQLEALKPILLSLGEQVRGCIGSYWRVANVRAWKTSEKSKEFGPTTLHTDGMPLSALKIMYYPLGASSEKGTVELQLKDSIYRVEGGPGTWVLFKNSEILHRGVIPQSGERIAVEFTILPSLSCDLTPISAGQNARNPVLPWTKPYSTEHPVYKKGEIIGINVGGGPRWKCEQWLNLEEVVSSANPYSFHLYPNCRFPIENDSIKTVYSSHAMEHLNEPTVRRVLSESCRVLEKGGDLIIKIPDYDKALDCWQKQDPSFFGSGWNMEGVIPLWSKRGPYDCVDYRASMVFCSFFNNAYGNPFGTVSRTYTAPPYVRNTFFENLANSPYVEFANKCCRKVYSICKNTYKKIFVQAPTDAYFGPAVVDTAFLRNLIQNNTPSQITKALCREIRFNEKDFYLCHQSAWSREELRVLLKEFNFEIVSCDTNTIIERFGNIPQIDGMKDLSTYCWAKKNK